ncbi:hypothetical protein [Methylobacterium oryzisoli]|uniref:hypothetical protein n=1 Tax=Methylobacterium oryzisoli TaxID=3385502 RepID=UPI003891AA2C
MRSPLALPSLARSPLALLALAALLAASTVPASAAEADASRPQPKAWTSVDDIDATGTVTPTDPILIPDLDGPEIDAERPRGDEGGPVREFVPE